eukprot:scaffold743_cov117-Cylindrotheca_fusiformis.AAC.20
MVATSFVPLLVGFRAEATDDSLQSSSLFRCDSLKEISLVFAGVLDILSINFRGLLEDEVDCCPLCCQKDAQDIAADTFVCLTHDRHSDDFGGNGELEKPHCFHGWGSSADALTLPARLPTRKVSGNPMGHMEETFAIESRIAFSPGVPPRADIRHSIDSHFSWIRETLAHE